MPAAEQGLLDTDTLDVSKCNVHPIIRPKPFYDDRMTIAADTCMCFRSAGRLVEPFFRMINCPVKAEAQSAHMISAA